MDSFPSFTHWGNTPLWVSVSPVFILIKDRRNTMPNWCNNIVELSAENAEDLSKLKEMIGNKDHPFDFQKIKPMPESLSITSGSDEMGYDAKYGDFKRMLEYPWVKEKGVETQQELIDFLIADYPEIMEKAEIYKSNVDKYGHKSWYGWCTENWGTKWSVSAEDIVVEDLGNYMRLTFNTAWSPAEGIYEALVLIIDEHNLGITVTWFYDEPGMQFAGYLGAA